MDNTNPSRVRMWDRIQLENFEIIFKAWIHKQRTDHTELYLEKAFDSSNMGHYNMKKKFICRDCIGDDDKYEVEVSSEVNDRLELEVDYILSQIPLKMD